MNQRHQIFADCRLLKWSTDINIWDKSSHFLITLFSSSFWLSFFFLFFLLLLVTFFFVLSSKVFKKLPALIYGLQFSDLIICSRFVVWKSYSEWSCDNVVESVWRVWYQLIVFLEAHQCCHEGLVSCGAFYQCGEICQKMEVGASDKLLWLNFNFFWRLFVTTCTTFLFSRPGSSAFKDGDVCP